MLFTDVSDRHTTAGRVFDRLAENLFGHEDPFRMVAKRPVAEVCHMAFRFVKPVVYGLIILGLSAPFARGRDGVMVWVRHY
jgi:hypothetical protein